jgi:serine/threonine-protein kinase
MIERELGHGAMATVYLARDTKHDRNVALKILHGDVAQALGPERFLREIRLLAQLQHPHILPLYDSGELRGALYYVMPYMGGESLRDYLTREGELPLADALRITREVADALAFAHTHNVVHRDIKPENILLSARHALVSDFGVARAISRAAGERTTSAGIVVGTPSYMSPEQASGDSTIDGRSDIYSLACVLYEMLTGTPPFIGATPQAIIARRFTAEPPKTRALRADVPPRVDAALARALSVAPEDRFATVEEFARELSSRDSMATFTSPARHAWWPFSWPRAR